MESANQNLEFVIIAKTNIYQTTPRRPEKGISESKDLEKG